MEQNKKNLFYCYKKAVADFLVRYGLKPVFHGVNHNTNADYWTFERCQALDDGLDAWQKQKWAKPKQTEEPKHDGSEAE